MAMSTDQQKEGLQELKSSKLEQDPHIMSSTPLKGLQAGMSSPQSLKQEDSLFFAPLKTKPPKEKEEEQDQQWKCSECNATFHHVSSLNFLVGRHTGEKPHVCSQCGKTFLRVESLKRHQESTSKEDSGSRSRHQSDQQEPQSTSSLGLSLTPSPFHYSGPPPFVGPFHLSSSVLTSSALFDLCSASVPTGLLPLCMSLGTSDVTFTTADGHRAGGGYQQQSGNDMTTLSQARKGKATHRRKVLKVSATSVRNDDEQPQNMSSSKRKNPSSSSGEATDLQTEDAKTEPPIFSRSWQFSETFTPKGGQLQGADSDVILTIPEKAVDDLIAEEPHDGIAIALPSMDAVKYESSGSRVQEMFTSDGTSQRQETASVDSTSTAEVTIHGAITTDLRGVHEKLKLTATESICSPVVEYYAGDNVMFKKPVCISLPHFLPPDVIEKDIRVYQVSRKGNEELCSETLRLVSKLEEIQAGDAVDEEREVGTFYLTEENGIIIVTNHFTGYFCTHCKQQKEPPDLQFRLYATEVEKKTGDVDLTLLIWDLRMRISDFRKPWAPDSKDQMTFITSTQLERLRNENVDDIRVGVWIHFLQTVWMHKTRPNGTPWLNPNKSFALRFFFPCQCHTEPKRVEWNIQCRKDPAQLQRSECYMYVDVGYARQYRPSFDFLEGQDKSTLRALLKMKENCTHTTVSSQTEISMETGELQGAMASPPRSDSNSSARNLLHGPGSLPQSCHYTPSVRQQGQPTLSEGGFGTKTVVNIAKVVANNVDLASMLHPQGSGRESAVEQNTRSATETCLAAGRAGSDQDVEETDRKSLTSSSGQGAHLNGSGSGWHSPGVRSSTSSVRRRDVLRPIKRFHDEQSIEQNGEDMNGSTLQATEAASPVSLEQSNGSSPSHNRERHSFQLQSPVPCSADVATNGSDGGHVPESNDSLSERLTNMDIVEDLLISTSAKDVCSL